MTKSAEDSSGSKFVAIPEIQSHRGYLDITDRNSAENNAKVLSVEHCGEKIFLFKCVGFYVVDPGSKFYPVEEP